MSLKNRLEHLYGPQSSSSLRSRLNKLRSSRDPAEIAQRLGGRLTSVNGENVVTISRKYDINRLHGKGSLELLRTFSSIHFARLCGTRPDDFDSEQILFLDTETTGLAGGTGTYVFLIGAGYLQGDHFELYQVFLHDLVAEPHILEELIRLVSSEIGRFRHLVTFNGKSYDLNLLETRFLLHRKQNPFADFHHIDLLYPSRVLWKGTLPDCSLQSLERNIIGYRRTGDIPSHLIPDIYFRYLRGNPDYRAFERIFQHNRLDILSLVQLLTELGIALDGTSKPGQVDPLRAAHLLTLRGRLADAIDLLKTALQHTRHDRTQIRMQLGLLYKRSGCFSAALEVLMELIRRTDSPPLLCYEEAAKILEHRQGSLDDALLLVDEAIDLHPDCESLKQRRRRIVAKIAGRKWY